MASPPPQLFLKLAVYRWKQPADTNGFSLPNLRCGQLGFHA
jgi:hypothetical protein